MNKRNKTRAKIKVETMPSAARVTTADDEPIVIPEAIQDRMGKQAPKGMAPAVLLPANVAGLAKLAAVENARYALTGVRVEKLPDGYACVATDGRVMAMVRGTSDSPDEFPAGSAAEADIGEGSEVVIPTKSWTEAFKGIPRRTFKDILRNVYVQLGDKNSLLTTTDLEERRTIEARNVDGRYPPYKEVFPKGPAKAVITVDPRLMIKVLTAAMDFCDEEQRGVDLEIFSDSVPMIVRKKRDKQEFTGVIMPLTREKK
jgi:DNA polymerase III sliding clamp (beta) subunit (PCNA family)